MENDPDKTQPDDVDAIGDETDDVDEDEDDLDDGEDDGAESHGGVDPTHDIMDDDTAPAPST